MVSKKSTPRAMGSFNDGIIKTEAMTGSNGAAKKGRVNFLHGWSSLVLSIMQDADNVYIRLG